jgi:transcriptional regulator with XRE-family HTH domain
MTKKSKSKIQLYVSVKVREFREEIGMSQETLAIKINRSRTFISNRENLNNAQAFNFNTVNEIALVLKRSPKDFLPEEPLS